MMNEFDTFLKLKYLPVRYDEAYLRYLPVEVFHKWFDNEWGTDEYPAGYETKINIAIKTDTDIYLEDDTKSLIKLLKEYHKE